MWRRPESQGEFMARQLAGLPGRWSSRLARRWHKTAGDHAPGDWVASVAAATKANAEIRTVAEVLKVVRVPLDATDSHICDAADIIAARVTELAEIWRTLPLLRAALSRVAAGFKVAAPLDAPGTSEHVEDGPAVARMADPLWWRRQLRKVHAKHVEGAAISLGYVNRTRDPYVSNESLARRAQQNDRNAKTLETTIATNEHGDEFTLAELAAKGPANKAIRRAELMTRIAGFERIAIDLGHVGLFMTVTCPSRMHKWRTVAGGRVMENPRYDGTLPGQSQAYLAKVWGRIRAALHRRGIGQYGFRIAEPQHDGTPHWHMLVFLDPAHVDTFRAVVAAYALADSPDEPGAAAHRVDFKPIDAGKGSAAGYIAKYVAKNIDGYRLDKDLIGNNAVETSHRVEAWAATWGIRQFQQIGGPPVGPWRELRRVPALPADAPLHVIQAHTAANRIADVEAGAVKSVAWDHYCRAQGGVFCGRLYLVRVAMLRAPEGDTSSRYGEAAAPKPIGVEDIAGWFVGSVRHAWTIARGLVEAAAEKVAASVRSLIASGRLLVNASPSAAPWTCVNNCTRPDAADRAELHRAEVSRALADEKRINANAWTLPKTPSRPAAGVT